MKEYEVYKYMYGEYGEEILEMLFSLSNSIDKLYDATHSEELLDLLFKISDFVMNLDQKEHELLAKTDKH